MLIKKAAVIMLMKVKANLHFSQSRSIFNPSGLGYVFILNILPSVKYKCKSNIKLTMGGQPVIPPNLYDYSLGLL